MKFGQMFLLTAKKNPIENFSETFSLTIEIHCYMFTLSQTPFPKSNKKILNRMKINL